MKRLFSLVLIFGGLAAWAAEPSTVPSQMLPGECIHSFSANGEWMVSELDIEGGMLIRNLKTGQQWVYYSDGMDNGLSYGIGFSRDISDDGTAVAEVSGIPSYWKNGKWTNLPQARGQAAVVGGITPDGSVIAGSVSTATSLRTRPCVWYRQEDGSYGDPVWLPDPVRNSVSGTSAQYVNAVGISDDGKTVAVSLRTGSGFNNIPYAYIQDENGKWTSKVFGEDIISPPDLEMPKSPGAYRGPSAPNYEAYMTPEQIEQFYAATDYAWLNELYAQGMNDEEVYVAGILYAAEFMSEANRARYEPLAKAFADAYLPWANAMIEYQKAMDAISDQMGDFVFNNVFVSPDGKYLYATAYWSVVEDPTNPEYGIAMFHAPVRFDIATGESVAYPRKFDVMMTGVTADYSVLGWDYDMDAHLYRPAYIFPGLSTDPVEIQDYFKDQGNSYAYTWLEENLYREVLVGFTASGAYRWDDAWTIGKPLATPDMTLWGFGTSTLYWSVLPEESALLATYILNPDYTEPEPKPEPDNTAVEAVLDSDSSIQVLKGGILQVEGNISELKVYDTSGSIVFSASAPEGYIETGLSSGIYIVKAITSSGETISKKALF